MTERRFWALSLAEPLASRNEDPARALCSSSDESAEGLADSWGISSPEEMTSILEWLRDEGHREEFREADEESHPEKYLAWDIVRLAQLVRWGVRAGYLDVAAGWRWLDVAATMASESFTDWPTYLDDYQAGFEAWSEDAEESAKVAEAVKELKDSSLPPWNPPAEPLPKPLTYRWRSFRKKTTLSAQFRTVFLGIFVVVVSIMVPWPLGAACGAAAIVTLALSSRLWGPTIELFLGLGGLVLAGSGMVGGYFRDYLPKEYEMAAAGLLFGILTAYLLAYFIIYSDDRTPASD